MQDDLPLLKGLPEGTALIRGLYTTICGSDMLYIHKPRAIDQCVGEGWDNSEDDTPRTALDRWLRRVSESDRLLLLR